jgi:hypothetical protein
VKRWLYLLSLLCLFASCENELPLPVPTEPAKITLIGELVAGDSVQIRAGQSMYLGSAPQLPSGLQIILKDSAGPETPFLQGADFKMYSLYTIPFSNATTIGAGKKYGIHAKHPTLGEVNAAVTIPNSFSATLVGKRFTSYAGDQVLDLDFDMNDNRSNAAKYVVEIVRRDITLSGYFFFQSIRYTVYDNKQLFDSLRNAGVALSGQIDTNILSDFDRQTFYAEDESSDDSTSSGRLFRRIFLTGARFNGSLHRTHLFVPRTYLDEQPGQYVQLVVNIKSVATDYFEYLRAYEAYSGGPEPGSNIVPKQLPGNVVGGFGMIGGVWRWSSSVVY